MTQQRTVSRLSILAGGLAGAATLLGLGSVAGAQQAAPAAPAQQQAAPNGVIPTEWFKVCSTQGENEICNAQYTVIAETRQLITAVNLITVTGKVNQKVIQAVVPSGRVIPAGVQIKIDGNAPQTLNYTVCFPDRCIAEAELADALVASMKRGNELLVTSVNFQRQANPVKITLTGFTQAFDGPPEDASALAQSQEQLNSALQAQAEARRQKFEEAQNAAKANAGDAASATTPAATEAPAPAPAQ